MNFKRTLLLTFTVIATLSSVIGCRYQPESDKADYTQFVVQTLQIGPYDFINKTLDEVFSTVFNDANLEIAKHGCSRSIGIILQISDNGVSDNPISISIPRNAIDSVFQSLAYGLGCTLTYENGVFHFNERINKSNNLRP